MKLVGRIPVEPLDDDRLTHIERRIVAGAADAAARGMSSAPHRYGGVLVAAIAGLAAGVIGWRLVTRPPASPAAITEAASTEAATIAVHTDVQRSTLDIGDATIESDPRTAFAVTRPDGGVLVDVTRGKVLLAVAKRAHRPPLVVRAGDTDVIVVGTRFSVDYGDGTGEVDVRVTEGVVQIVRHHQTLRVAAGSAFRTSRGVIALADAGAPLSRSPDDAFAVPLGDGPDVLHGRTAQVPDPHVVPQQHAGADGARLHEGSGSGARPRPVQPTGSPWTDLQRAILAQPVEPASDVGEPTPARAIAKYNDIVVHTTGDEASRAFYSKAVVQATKLGRTEDALRTLDLYLRRFAGGKEHTAALWLRVRILCSRAIDEPCRQAAYSFGHQAPEGPATSLAELITISE